jgi:hypothetical protein
MESFTAHLNQEFSRLYSDWLNLIETIPAELLYRRPAGGPASFPFHSCGEELLRSAATVEQTFGGISTNLWDDPFEWTLPETLPTRAKIAGYLAEVDATRRRGFELFKSDADLLKEIMAPAGKIQLFPLLLDTLVRAGHHLASARETCKRLQVAR